MKKKELALQDPESTTCRRKTTIGGQALIEGLLMIGPEKKAMAVRLPDGSISVEAMPMVQFSGMANWPFVRGSIRLFRQLVSGTKALLRSAELSDDETVAEQAAVGFSGSTVSAGNAAYSCLACWSRLGSCTSKWGSAVCTVSQTISRSISK